MNESRISVRYARALFQSALEKNILDRINIDMQLLQETCAQPELKDLLSNPVVKPAKKTDILHSLLGKEVHPLTLALVDLVIKNGRENYLPAIARAFVFDTKKYKGITETILTTAVKVDHGIKNQITQMIGDLFKTKVDLKEVIDDTIIGGFVLKVEDNFIDASVKNKLRKIKKELTAGSGD
jgi:F-type H+-transporting ATPase subunit delta